MTTRARLRGFAERSTVASRAARLGSHLGREGAGAAAANLLLFGALAMMPAAGCSSDYVPTTTDAGAIDAGGDTSSAPIDAGDGGGATEASSRDDASLDSATPRDTSNDPNSEDISADRTSPPSDVGSSGDARPIDPDANDGALPPLDPPKLTTHRLTTRGPVLIDETGRTVILRGVNVSGRSKMPPFMPFEIGDAGDIQSKASSLMSSIKRLGANAVRLTFSWEALETVKGTYDTEYLRRFRLLLDAAQEADLYVIVDFHQDVFHAAFCGDGFPEWALGDIAHGAPHYDCLFPFWSLPYFDTASTVSQAFDRLWTNKDGLLDQFEVTWRYLAHEIGKHPAVAAFEIINEPGVGSSTLEKMGSMVLPALYDRIAATIESEAGAAAILCDEPISSNAEVQYLARPAHPRFVYAPHYYDSLTMLGLGPLDANRIRTAVTALLGRATTWSAPTVVGEFGAPNSVTFKTDYLSAFFDSLDAANASALLWDASASAQKWNNEDFGPLLPDGTETAWAGILDRAVARAIDGTIGKSTWDPVAKQFSITVTTPGDQVSEIYLPTRHVGMTPDLVVTGARFRYTPQTGQLLVLRTDPSSWSVTAKAK